MVLTAPGTRHGLDLRHANRPVLPHDGRVCYDRPCDSGLRHDPAGDALGARVGASMIDVIGTPVACRARRRSFKVTKGKVGV